MTNEFHCSFVLRVSFEFLTTIKTFILLNFFRYVSGNVTTSEEKEQVADLEKNIIKRKAQLYDIEQTLPQPSGTYLKVYKHCGQLTMTLFTISKFLGFFLDNFG